MENFILYEEIGRGKNSIVYKGRRKGTIKFLAILCIEKSERAAITNWVRLVHEVEHDNIVKFYEWYETSNHLWMVVELCTGGLLQEILNQDGVLPEKTVCQFGKDVLAGISYLHDRGIVFADLSPKKILLDGPGNLKLTNFCISRLQEEHLEDVYIQAMSDESQQIKSSNLTGSLEYQAPEVAEGNAPTLSSDIWSFGILLFQLYTGCFPFSTNNSSQTLQEEMLKSKRKLLHRQVPQVLKDEKPSDDFSNLVQLILQKEPNKRPSADELLKHSFWNAHQKKNNSVSPQTATSKDFNKENTTPKLKNNSASTREESVSKSLGKRSVTPETVSVLDSTFTLSSRPHTAYSTSQATEDKLMKPASARPQTPLNQSTYIMNSINELAKSSGRRPMSAASARSIVVDSLVVHDDPSSAQHTATTTFLDIKEFIYHDSDFELSVIQDNSQVRKVDSLKWETKSLPFQSVSSVGQMTPDEVYHHLKQITEALNQPASTNYMRLKTNVLVYLAHLCTCSTAVANYVINSNILSQLASIVKSSSQQSPDIACKAARVIGLAASYATELEQCTKLCDSMSVLVDSFRENFRNTRIKIALLPCIGQLLFLVTEQEEASLSSDDQQTSGQRSNWSIPSATYSQITKCLREGEDPVVQHFACKTIEAVTTLPSQHGKRFITASAQGSSSQTSSHSDVIGPLLWTVAGRASNENLKVSALTALCRLNKLSGTGLVFQAAVDRTGLSSMLSMLSRASFRCQQAIITSLVETLQSAPKGHAARLANGKDLLPNLMRLFDSTSALVRTKLILAVLLLLKKVPTLLVAACQQRLIMYLERESRRVAITSAGQSSSSNNEYTQSCLNLLIHHLAMQAPMIATNCIAILDETVVRKHPSSNQVKQLRQLLPTCLVLQHFVTSQIFRSQIVNSEFVDQLGLLLSHATIFLKKTSQSSLASSIGDEIVQKFIDAVISIIECLSQHPLVLTQHAESSMTSLVPNIILLLGAYGDGDGQIVCIKLLTDVLGALLHYRAMSMDMIVKPSLLTPLNTPPSRAGSASSVHSARYRRQDVPDEYGVRAIIKNKLVPGLQSVLVARDPLPAYGVRLLGTLLEFWPSLSVEVYSHNLIPTLMVSFDKQSSNVKLYVQGVTTVLTYLVQFNDEKTVALMYEKGLIEMLGNYVMKASKQYYKDPPAAGDASMSYPDTSSQVECLTQLLSLMKAMLDRVTMYVKQTLQQQRKYIKAWKLNVDEMISRFIERAEKLVDTNSQNLWSSFKKGIIGAYNKTQQAASSDSIAKVRTEQAEQMLLDHKPLTELQSICIRLLCAEQELHELALACLSMLVQLYGGDHADTMSSSNMASLAQVLTRMQPKRQRILLKLIKRIVNLNKTHAERLASAPGSSLLQSIQMTYDNAEKIADAPVANLAADILKIASSNNS